MFPVAFPYLSAPLAGSPNGLSLTLTLQQSGYVNGQFTDVPATYDNSTSSLTTARGSTTPSFYRVRSDLQGVRLGTPAVTSTNVVLGLRAP
jgi:hypothetical protein